MSSDPDNISSNNPYSNIPVDQWNESDFSTSSNKLLEQISSNPEGVNLIKLLELLNGIHPEYGSTPRRNAPASKIQTREFFQQLISFIRQKETLLNLSKFTADQWANEVLSISRKPERPQVKSRGSRTPITQPVITGRIFMIASLLSRFSEVFTQLNKDVAWQKLCIEVIEKLDDELIDTDDINYHSLLTEKGNQLLTSLNNAATDDKEMIDESIIDTNNLSDGPAQSDSLSRMALAKYLAKRLRHIYNRDIDKGKYGSFFMHIDGAWGSGKTTLLGFLEKQLEANAPHDPKINSHQSSEGKWVVINFNAWENQRLDPPWWFLMKSVYRQTMELLNDQKNAAKSKDKKIARRLFLNEQKWRLTTGKNYLLAVGITFFLFLISIFLGVNGKDQFNKLPVIELITFIGFLWSLAKLFSSSLASGSGKAAKSFIEENSKDPMQVLANHFKEQIGLIGYPVAIFIDDLDRCNIDYGIKLLEGLQTIFKKAGVVYIIAADRKWLSKMFETQYTMFASVIERPAKPFGLIFLDKIFQLIVELPDISSIQKKIYWNNLLNVSNPNQSNVTEADRTAIKKELKAAGTNARKMNIASQKSDSPEIQQVAREEALGSVSIGEEEKLLEHTLQKYVDLIEPNPRAMKRLINDISTARAISYLYDQDVDQDQLILWTILKLQHPVLAQFFWNYPQKISEVTGYKDLATQLTEDIELNKLILKEEVKNLFSYETGPDKTVILDKDFIRKLKFQIDKNIKKPA